MRLRAVEGCAGEPARWFAEHVQPHDAALRGYLRSRFSVLGDVDDIVQEAYLRLWKSHITVPVRYVRSFLFTTARNVALDTLRRQRASPFDDVTRERAYAVPEESPGAAERIGVSEEFGFLAAAMDSLPPRCRETLKLNRLTGLSRKEVASRLGISESTVGNQVQHGLRRCAEYLGAQGVST